MYLWYIVVQTYIMLARLPLEYQLLLHPSQYIFS